MSKMTSDHISRLNDRVMYRDRRIAKLESELKAAKEQRTTLLYDRNILAGQHYAKDNLLRTLERELASSCHPADVDALRKRVAELKRELEIQHKRNAHLSRLYSHFSGTLSVIELTVREAFEKATKI